LWKGRKLQWRKAERRCSASLSSGANPLGAAEKFAEEVEGKVFAAVEEHISVTSRDIKRLAKNALWVYHPDAAEIYALEEAF
jgi:hypothetical protein